MSVLLIEYMRRSTDGHLNLLVRTYSKTVGEWNKGGDYAVISLNRKKCRQLLNRLECVSVIMKKDREFQYCIYTENMARYFSSFKRLEEFPELMASEGGQMMVVEEDFVGTIPKSAYIETEANRVLVTPNQACWLACASHSGIELRTPMVGKALLLYGAYSVTVSEGEGLPPLPLSDDEGWKEGWEGFSDGFRDREGL